METNQIRNTGPLLLVGGDLSGIQKFIYNISSRKAAVSLKGRSYYLIELIDQILKRFIKWPGIQATAKDVVYSSGGKFYIETVDTPETRNAIQAFRKEIEKELWDKHYGQLSVNIGYVPFSYNADGSVNVGQEKNVAYGRLLKAISDKLTQQKGTKFKDVILDEYDKFFEVNQVSGDQKVCAVTGIESEECVSIYDEEREESMYVLPSVKEQINLGESLRNTDGSKPFNDLAKDSSLGILRMDVDGLGKVFINGFPKKKDYTDFSTKLQQFFEYDPESNSKLKQLRFQPEYKDFVNIVYAGGDDVFAVGRWDKLIDFANDLRKSFADYMRKTMNRSDITISGGVAIVSPKFPIAKAAEMAGDAEDSAKKFRDSEKNAFNMFGESLSWKDEFDYVENYKNQFVDLIENFDMSKSILHRIMLFGLKVKANKQRVEEGKSKDYSYMWHAAYFLSRFKERYKKQKQITEFCDDLKINQLSGNERRFELMALAARWAELEIRDYNKNNNNYVDRINT